jgi:protein SCO1/2
MIDKSIKVPGMQPGHPGQLVLWVGIAASGLVAPGCGGMSGPESAAAPARPPALERRRTATVTDYPLRGVVRSVAPESGRVLIRHEAIPGFMGAMTMPFAPADRAILGTLHPGDEVAGTLRVEQEDGAVKDYQLLGLKVTRPAEPPAQVLDFSGGKVQLRPGPRRLEVGDPVPDFTMTGQDGGRFQLSDLRGKVVVLTFIYTRCPMPDFCPYMDRRFSELAGRVSAFPSRAKGIRLISLSFDPEHDTPEVLRKHAAIRGAAPPLWSYAVAAPGELAKIAPRLGLEIRPDGGEIAHNLSTAVIDPQGKLARLEVGRQANHWETADLLKTIYARLPIPAK